MSVSCSEGFVEHIRIRAEGREGVEVHLMLVDGVLASVTVVIVYEDGYTSRYSATEGRGERMDKILDLAESELKHIDWRRTSITISSSYYCTCFKG